MLRIGPLICAAFLLQGCVTRPEPARTMEVNALVLPRDEAGCDFAHPNREDAFIGSGGTISLPSATANLRRGATPPATTFTYAATRTLTFPTPEAGQVFCVTILRATRFLSGEPESYFGFEIARTDVDEMSVRLAQVRILDPALPGSRWVEARVAIGFASRTEPAGLANVVEFDPLRLEVGRSLRPDQTRIVRWSQAPTEGLRMAAVIVESREGQDATGPLVEAVAARLR